MQFDCQLMSEDEQSNNEQSCDQDQIESQDFSMRSSSSLHSFEQSSGVLSKKALGHVVPIEEQDQEYLSDSQSNISSEHDRMFFSCADWETQIKLSSENMPECADSLPIVNKRKAKFASKFGLTPAPASVDEFDVDLVMKKQACLNQTEKVVSKKAYFQKCKPVTPFDLKISESLPAKGNM